MIAVYGVGKDYDGTLFSNTQSILRNLAELNRDLMNIINKHFRDSISKASRIATRLVLQYHHVSHKNISFGQFRLPLLSVLSSQQDHKLCVLYTCTSNSPRHE